MARSDDQRKPTAEEGRAINQYVSKHPRSTLLKEERTARYIQRTRLREQGQTPAEPTELKRNAMREEKYGSADWTLPELRNPPPKLFPAGLWDAIEEFVQLSDTKLERFKNRYPAFFPRWFYKLTCGND